MGRLDKLPSLCVCLSAATECCYSTEGLHFQCFVHRFLFKGLLFSPLEIYKNILTCNSDILGDRSKGRGIFCFSSDPTETDGHHHLWEGKEDQRVFVTDVLLKCGWQKESLYNALFSCICFVRTFIMAERYPEPWTPLSRAMSHSWGHEMSLDKARLPCRETLDQTLSESRLLGSLGVWSTFRLPLRWIWYHKPPPELA